MEDKKHIVEDRGGFAAKFRYYLRVVISCLSLLIGVAIASLWVHSYSYRSLLVGGYDERIFTVKSQNGRMVWNVHPSATPTDPRFRWVFSHGSITNDMQGMPPKINFLFNVYNSRSSSVVVPYWSLIIATIVLGFLSKPHQRFRISFRELLVITTVIAIALGALEALFSTSN